MKTGVTKISLNTVLYNTIPFTDSPQICIFSFVNVILYCNPSASDDIPSSPISLLCPMLSSCSELLTFNNLPRRLAPVVTITISITQNYKDRGSSS